MVLISFSLPYGVLMSHKLLLLVSALVCSRDARAQATGGSATVEVGGTAILPCKLTRKLTGYENLVQISWQRETKGKPLTDNFFTINEREVLLINGQDKRFQYIGTFADQNGTLQLSNVNLKDAGTYTCIFSIFPDGDTRTVIPLTVLVPLETSVNDTLPTLGNEEVPLVTCTAAGFNPPAEVSWKTDGLKDKVRWTNNSTLHVSDTTVTVSTLLGKPTKEINRRWVQCVILSEKLNKTLPFEIQIYYPPLNVNIKEGPMKNVGFTCEAEANPNPNITWSRSGSSLPLSVRAEGAVLTFKKKSPDLAGLYQCEANNVYGSKQSFLYVDFPSEGGCKGLLVTFIILLLLLVAVLAFAAVLYKRGFLKLPSFKTGQREAVPTSSPEEAASDSNSREQPRGGDGSLAADQNAETQTCK